MRFISTKTHAVNDYIFGILLIVIPLFWINSAVTPDAAVWVPVAVGIVVLLQSLMTDYEFSLTNQIPVPLHLFMDAGAGLFLAASPWLFGFDDVVWVPHLIVGITEIGLALTTQHHRTDPRQSQASTHATA